MFGIDVFDAALLPSLMIALVAGVVSFLSPCVLPIVPPYLAYMTGASIEDMQGHKARRAAITSVFFVMGLSTVFLFLGFAASSFGRVLMQYQTEMTQIAGAVIIVFGLHFIGLFRIPFLFREARIDAGDRGGSLFGAYVLGLAFAFGWTPCIGPILGAILALVAQDASTARGMAMMGVYALGLGVPFVLAALFMGRAVGLMARMRRHMRRIEIASGLLLLAVGILMITGGFTRMSWWLLEQFPALGAIG